MNRALLAGWRGSASRWARSASSSCRAEGGQPGPLRSDAGSTRGEEFAELGPVIVHGVHGKRVRAGSGRYYGYLEQL